MRNPALAFTACAAVLALSGTLAFANSLTQQGKLQLDGRARTYEVHLPRSYDGTQPVPLVLALHGRLGNGPGEEKLAGLDKVSDKYGFLAVYPNGLDRSWADGRDATPSDRNNVDDVKFLSALIDRMEQEYNIDRSRIYVMGMSNGGFMTARLACDLSNRIAAVGIVAASLSANTAADCHPEKPLSVLIIQGSEDPLVPLQGGALRKDRSGGEVLSHAATVQKFAQLDECSSKPQTQRIPDQTGDGTTIDAVLFSGCAAGTEVRGYMVNGGGHTWPGGVQYLPAALIGKTTHNLNASDLIWEFFSNHQR